MTHAKCSWLCQQTFFSLSLSCIPHLVAVGVSSVCRSRCSPPGGCCILQVWRSENTSHFSSIIATAFLTGLRIVYFLFLLRFLCVYIQVPSACAQSWYESDRLAWRASERPLACPSGQTTTPLHWCSLVCCRGPSGGTTNSNAKQ